MGGGGSQRCGAMGQGCVCVSVKSKSREPTRDDDDDEALSPRRFGVDARSSAWQKHCALETLDMRRMLIRANCARESWVSNWGKKSLLCLTRSRSSRVAHALSPPLVCPRLPQSPTHTLSHERKGECVGTYQTKDEKEQEYVAEGGVERVRHLEFSFAPPPPRRLLSSFSSVMLF